MKQRALLPLALLLSLFAPLLAYGPAAAQPAKSAPSTCNSFYQGNRPPAIVGGGHSVVVFCHRFYATAYSTSLRNPMWTSYRLTKAMALGADAISSNSRRFGQQAGLTAAQQGNHDDYVHPPFDRGHMVPANDASDMPSQRDTYVVTNIVPQISEMNQGQWRFLEASVHRLARDENEVFIVSGPVFRANPPLMHRPGQTGRIAIPDFTYKAIFVPSRNIAVGFLMSNNVTPVCTIMSIRDLTARIGVDPFPALPAVVKATRPNITLPEGDNVHLPDCRPSP